MVIKKCGLCGLEKEEVWTFEEIGKGNWNSFDLKWFKKNEPICCDCIEKRFKVYFDEYGHLKKESETICIV